MNRLTDKEYEILADEYSVNPPELSGRIGFVSQLKQQALVKELLDSNYARIVNEKASAMSVSPSEIIQSAIIQQLLEVS
jgi:hypothetical protein